MGTRDRARNWLKNNHPEELVNRLFRFRSSKYFPDGLWWLTFPSEFFDPSKTGTLCILLQYKDDLDQFHFLKVPYSFFRENQHKFDINLTSDEFDLHISAKKENWLIDERGEGVSFRSFYIQPVAINNSDANSQVDAQAQVKHTQATQQPLKSSDDATLEESIRKFAIACAGNNGDFENILNRIKLDAYFPIEFCKIMEQYLCNMLKTKNLSLYDLISQVKDAQLLPDEAIDLAHFIRKQRNTSVHHNDTNENIRKMRAMCVLTAASLLWPYLTVDDS